MTRPDFDDAVIAYLALMGASETSGRRTRLHNNARRGVAHSPHLVGLARDVVYDLLPPLRDAQVWAGRLGLRLIREPDHDHLQPLDWIAG